MNEIATYIDFRDQVLNEYFEDPHRDNWESLEYVIRRNFSIEDMYFSRDASSAYTSLRQILAEVGIADYKKIGGMNGLWIGPGIGLGLRIAQDLGGNIIGVDINRRIVENSQRFGIVTSNYVVASAEDYMPCLQSALLDIILAQHMNPAFIKQGLSQVYRQAFRVLRPGGALVVTSNVPAELTDNPKEFPHILTHSLDLGFVFSALKK